MFDQALAGGGAKSINFQDLAADLAEITFAYPFRIPAYFAYAPHKSCMLFSTLMGLGNTEQRMFIMAITMVII